MDLDQLLRAEAPCEKEPRLKVRLPIHVDRHPYENACAENTYRIMPKRRTGKQ
jgi:hypothetical protein